MFQGLKTEYWPFLAFIGCKGKIQIAYSVLWYAKALSYQFGLATHSRLRQLLIRFQAPETKTTQVWSVCFKDSKNVLHDILANRAWKGLTLLKFFHSYQPNSERVLRHGSHQYKWGQHFMKISLRLNEGNLKNSKIPISLLNKSRYFSHLNLVPPLSAAPQPPRVIQGCPKVPPRVVEWPLKAAEKPLFFS